MQLTLDGREEPHPAVVRARAFPLTELQRELVGTIVRDGSIRTSVAGRVVHAVRGNCGYGVRYPRHSETLGCCRFAAADGHAALLRLSRRGLVEQHTWGVWRLKSGRQVEVLVEPG